MSSTLPSMMPLLDFLLLHNNGSSNPSFQNFFFSIILQNCFLIETHQVSVHCTDSKVSITCFKFLLWHHLIHSTNFFLLHFLLLKSKPGFSLFLCEIMTNQMKKGIDIQQMLLAIQIAPQKMQRE